MKFYNRYIDTIGNEIYNDYDKLNRILINIKLFFKKKIKEYAKFHQDGKCKMISLELVNKFIEDISNLDIDKVEKEVISNPEKWTKISELKKV